jgi:protein MAK16
MQHDDVVWRVLNNTFCSFKVKIRNNTFCRNEYNVTGLCNKSSCPLANSRYATIIEKDGWCYLYMKTIERAHTPANLWERVKLSKNIAEAMKQINEHLIYWPSWLKNKVKQRLVKIKQYLIKTRRMATKIQPKLIGIRRKEERRETSREAKALLAAQLENSIKQELINRWKAGTYKEEIHNYPLAQFESALEDQEKELEDEEVSNQPETVEEFIEYDEDLEDYDAEHEVEDEQNFDNLEDLDEDDEDDEPLDKKRKGSGKDKPIIKKPHVSIEYEEEGPSRTAEVVSHRK